MKSLMIWIAVLLAIGTFVSLFDTRSATAKSDVLAYSEFISKIDEGSVKEVVQSGDVIAGKFENGITAVGLDITGFVKFGDAENVLAIKVDNSNDYREEATGAGYQWMGRAFNPNFGGLNRDVTLHISDNLHQTLPLYRNRKLPKWMRSWTRCSRSIRWSMYVPSSASIQATAT